MTAERESLLPDARKRRVPHFVTLRVRWLRHPYWGFWRHPSADFRSRHRWVFDIGRLRIERLP